MNILVALRMASPLAPWREDVTSGRLKKTVLWFGSVKPHVKTTKRSNAELLQASSPWPSGTVSGVFFEQRRWEELYEYLGCIENGQSFGALKGDVTSGRLKKTVLWFGSVKPHVKTIKKIQRRVAPSQFPLAQWHRIWGVFWATEMGGALWISWLHWEWSVLGALKGDVTSGRLKKTVLWFGSVKPHVKTIKKIQRRVAPSQFPLAQWHRIWGVFEQRRWEELYEYLGCIENGQSFGALKGDVTSGRLKKTVLWFGSVKPHVKTIKKIQRRVAPSQFPLAQWHRIWGVFWATEMGGALWISWLHWEWPVLWRPEGRCHFRAVKKDRSLIWQRKTPCKNH